MSTAKTKIEQAELESFFQEHLHIAQPKYIPIEEGEVSQAYFYDTPGSSQVLRLNARTQEGFQKDDYAATHFARYGVPIPQIIEIGQLQNGLYYSVSERAPGIMASKYSLEEVKELMPSLMKVLHTIHSIPPLGDGYGHWNIKGHAPYGSWHEAVKASLEADDDEKLSTVDFFDKALHDSVKAEVHRLLALCPHERKLLHGDYGFKNVLALDNKVTGVIDWHSSMYGDPLYDVAWLDFWRPEHRYIEHFLDYARQGETYTNLRERLTCYGLAAGANSMAFFAKSEQTPKYDFSVRRVNEILVQD